ncbi:hypothetical protein CEUSTIGMA_g13512.t1 [Chlamydomonas eustigma]|uniref:Inositol-pentakisphosphate 2-kinase n=1 Tax=Chlamydomonas eustigma TaxID=1157962 RepID=A0A250XT12_9CHLO|nr:hypothetical protein CEUSTIGMA_g13512.t1 [Chlamydomonas eustigma]|eukprot:GAX86099.1 hypothetical protein CEUSTIGMA_g13512.t1 [Chlamydomonas eustigma]
MDWRVAGEGNANMVLTYTGASTALQGCALRVPKHLPLENSAQELLQADRPLGHIIEETIWGDVLPSVHKLMVEQQPSHEPIEHAHAAEPIGHAHALMLRQMMYIERVLKPLMGACYAQSGVPVKLPSEAAVVLKGCGVPAEAGQPAMLLNDATSLASVAKVLKHKDLRAKLTGPVLCMELKPKWGFLPSTKHMSEPAAHVNGVVPRFTQHQLLKAMMHNGSTRTSKIQSPSDDFQNTNPTTCSTMDELDALGFSHYNPLDLFSGEESRMLKSLRALIQVPGVSTSVKKLLFLVGIVV